MPEDQRGLVRESPEREDIQVAESHRDIAQARLADRDARCRMRDATGCPGGRPGHDRIALVALADAAQQRLLQLQVADRVLGAGVDDHVGLDVAHPPGDQQQSLVDRARGYRQVTVRRALGVRYADLDAVVAEIDFDARLLQAVDAEDAVGVGKDGAGQHRQLLVGQHDGADPHFVHDGHGNDRGTRHPVHLDRVGARRGEPELCRQSR